jgi:hypothetical protein
MAFSYYKTVTTDHTQCGASDSTDYPIVIWTTDTDLKDTGHGGYVQNTNGYDIRPYADALLTSALPYELVFYDGVNGKLELHFKVPTLNHTSDVIYYLAFGDPGISTDGSSTSTWSSYAAVYHFKDGTTLSVADSTGTHNGTNHGAAPDSGVLDASVFFGGSTEYVSAARIDPLNNTQHFTWSSWIYNYGGGLKTLVSHGISGDAYQFLLLTGSNEANLIVDISPSSSEDDNNTYNGVVAIGSWTLWHVVYDGTASGAGSGVARLKLYINSVLQTASVTNGAIPATTPNASSTLNLGRQNTADRYWEGNLDECRFAGTSLSADWITADYNNQRAGSSFLTYGSRTTVGKRFILIPN